MSQDSSSLTTSASLTPPTTPPRSKFRRTKRPLSPIATNMPMTPPPTAPSSPRAPPDASRCTGASHVGLASLSHPKALEAYSQLRVFPWDVTCLNLLTHRRKIFGDILSQSWPTTKKVEYLVELRFLAKALRGWIEVVCGRSPHCLGSVDRRFVLASIANAYAEIPVVVKELAVLEKSTYSTSVKSYCREVCSCLEEIYESADARTLYKHVLEQQQ